MWRTLIVTRSAFHWACRHKRPEFVSRVREDCAVGDQWELAICFLFRLRRPNSQKLDIIGRRPKSMKTDAVVAIPATYFTRPRMWQASVCQELAILHFRGEELNHVGFRSINASDPRCTGST